MIRNIKYLKFDGNEELIKEYFDALFFFREKKAVDALRNFCEFRGYAINDYMRCYFATEFTHNEEDYFGENGVAFYLDSPAVPEDCIMILTYENFEKVVRESYEEYIKGNQDEKNEMTVLLDSLKKNLLE